jgi:hypothetical protein
MSVFQKMGLVAGTLSTLLVSTVGLNATAAASPTPIIDRPSMNMTGAMMPDGVYLYGQTLKPNELGRAYFVFEVKQGKVLGALYMPQSSFDCAVGSFQRDQLALKVQDAYEKQVFAYAIELDKGSTVASTNPQPLKSVGLDGFQRLDRVSNSDLQILNTCKQTYQAKGW